MAEANPYADFDNLRTPEAPAGFTPGGVPIGPNGRPRVSITKSEAGEQNPFARFDSFRGNEPRSDKSPTLRSVAMQLPTGFYEVTADTLGAPVDATTWLINKGLQGAHALTGAFEKPQRLSELVTGEKPGPIQIEHPFGGSESIKRGMAAVGVPNPDELPAENAVERFARGTGGGIAGMIVRRSEGAGDLAKTSAVGATAGATGETAAELAPDQYKPVARLAGNAAGGVGGALAAEVPRLAVQTARGARDYVAPMSQAGQEATAGATLSDRASNPTEVIERLNEPRPVDTGMTVPRRRPPCRPRSVSLAANGPS